MAESWYKVTCRHCDKVNWVCNGDEQDVTVSDVAGCICWKCKAKVPLSDDAEDELYDEDVDDVDGYWADGLKKPV